MSLQTALATDCLNKPICRGDPESPVIRDTYLVGPPGYEVTVESMRPKWNGSCRPLFSAGRISETSTRL